MANDIVRQVTEFESHVLIPWHRSVEVEVLMSVDMKVSPGVDTMLFRIRFTVIMSTVGVLHSHGHVILLPPTVRRTLYGSSFSGL